MKLYKIKIRVTFNQLLIMIANYTDLLAKFLQFTLK